MVEAVFLLYFKGFGMVSLVKSLLLLCQLLSTFLLRFYYKQMNLDFPESELQLLLALQAATGFQAYTGWQYPDYIKGNRPLLK